MKLFKSLPIFFIFCLPAVVWSAGDFDEETLAVEQITPNPKPQAIADKPTPFSLSCNADFIGKSKIKKGFFKDDEIKFAEAQVEAGMVFYYNECFSEGANVAVTYAVTRIEWEQNLFTNQDLFHTVSLSFGFFTKRVDRWLWKIQIAANCDTPGKNFTGEYINYDGILWGRYDYCKHIGLHFGFIAETGMRMDKAWPIFGFDWQINEHWKLNAVYPVNIGINYSFWKYWSVGADIRFFNTRHRIKRDEAGSRDVIRYENTGAELALMYQRGSINYNIHGGYTLGGKYRIANPSNNHPRTYDFKGAGYAGAEVDVRF